MASPKLLIDDRQAWLEARTRYLGGTDIAVLLGKNPYKTPADLFLEKTGQSVDESSRKAQMGTALEPYLRRWVAEDLSLEITQLSDPVFDAEYSFLAANIDGLIELEASVVFGDHVLTGPGLWEGKTYDFGTKDNWGEAWTDQVPIHYWCQAQWYTGIAGRTWTLIAALDRGTCDWTPYVVRHDAETFQLMRRLGVKFWREHIETGAPPPLTEKDANNVLALYPEPIMPGCDCTDEIEEIAARMSEIYPERKALNAEWDALSDRLKVSIAAGHRVATPYGEFAYQIRKGKTGKTSLALKTPFKETN